MTRAEFEQHKPNLENEGTKVNATLENHDLTEQALTELPSYQKPFGGGVANPNYYGDNFRSPETTKSNS